MNNPIKLLISGADMGGLIASCALHHDFHESSLGIQMDFKSIA